jgi:hypothetical protein
MSPRAARIIAPKFKIVELTDMTIHWKALEGHFLMVPFKFGGMQFLNFS